MMKDKIIKVLQVLTFLVYCVCAVLSVAAFLIYCIVAFPLASGAITAEHPLCQFAVSSPVLMTITLTPIATILCRIAYRRELKNNPKRKLAVYIPILLFSGEYVMFLIYWAMNLYLAFIAMT